MRDPARIERMIELLWDVWRLYPDMRFGQLVVNAIRPSEPCQQIFGPEDDLIERGLLAMKERAVREQA